MLKFYIHKKLDKVQHIPLMNHYWGAGNLGVKRYGDKALGLFNRRFFEMVDNPESADYFLIPHNFFYIKDQGYLSELISLSNKYQKKIIIFSYGDSDGEINVPNSIVFRTSQYKYKLRKNEIIMPAIADDLLDGGSIELRSKCDKPIVGFCGWASFGSLNRMIIESIKLFLIYIKSIFVGKNSLLHKRGIIFRMEALKVLKHSVKITPNFIIRDSFSGNEKTIKMDAEKARSEYVYNILNSDISLAVKGDGNFSIRFYEILSLGRIPVLIDTDCVLPLEDEIRYEDFIVRVPSSNLRNLDVIISDFFSNLSPEEFNNKQKRAREIFENYLRADKYFEYVLNSQFLEKYEISN